MLVVLFNFTLSERRMCLEFERKLVKLNTFQKLSHELPGTRSYFCSVQLRHISRDMMTLALFPSVKDLIESCSVIVID